MLETVPQLDGHKFKSENGIDRISGRDSTPRNCSRPLCARYIANDVKAVVSGEALTFLAV